MSSATHTATVEVRALINAEMLVEIEVDAVVSELQFD